MKAIVVKPGDRVFPIRSAEAAHAYGRENRNIGKVILEVPGAD